MTTLRLDAFTLDQAVRILQEGGPVAIPTETVYGLAARIDRADALASIFVAKGRPADNPLIVHCADVADIDAVAILDDRARRLAAMLMPGPLTIVVPRTPVVNDIVTAGLDTVAVRVPAHTLARTLIRAVGCPLAAPSANISGRPSPTTAQHVLADLDGRIPAVLDGGPCSEGIESTVVGLSSDHAVLLRPGAIPASTIEAVLGQPLRRAVATDGGSPGMKYRHYAPKAAVELMESQQHLEKRKHQLEHEGRNVFVVVPLAATLYADLRMGDLLQADRILVLCDGTIRRNEALLNRLMKAAEPFTHDTSAGHD
jgi:L-threonylcarbamoyladenylate synthase